MMSSATAVSRTVRVSTPSVGSPIAPSVHCGDHDTRPRVGLSPTRPQQDAGMRIDPPPALPWASETMPEATAAPLPAEEPPGVWPVSYGLRHGPKRAGSVTGGMPSSGVFVLPTTIAPAARSLRTVALSSVGTKSPIAAIPFVVRMPSVQAIRSLIATGTPASGRSSPCWTASASASARSAASVTNAFSSSFSASIVRSDSSTSSRELTSPERIKSACSVAGRVRYSVAMAEDGTLAPNGVTRIRAPNPSPLTLDGTNTYVAGGWVIDPGPDDPAHLDAVAAHGPFEGIVLTHSHHDHAEGAPALAARAGVEAILPSGGDRVGPFEVIATPGHSPDSVALLFGRVLFAGDTVLGTGSVFVGGEEGSMAAYLDSLRRLLELDLDAICPGHGPVIWEPRAKLEEYLSHRLERERLVVEALSAGAQTRDEVLDRAWSDVDFEAAPYLRFAAGVTLDAHLDKLSAEGRLRDEISRLR